MLIFFIMATIVFTYGYEGVISSFVTANPPVFVFETLKDLIQNGCSVMSVAGHRFILESLFDGENITSSYNGSIVLVSSVEEYNVLALGNTGTIIQAGEAQYLKLEMTKYYANVSCHGTTRSYALRDEIFQIVGLAHEQFVVSLEGLIVSGIVKMYYQYYIQFYHKDDVYKGCWRNGSRRISTSAVYYDRLENALDIYTMGCHTWNLVSSVNL